MLLKNLNPLWSVLICNLLVSSLEGPNGGPSTVSLWMSSIGGHPSGQVPYSFIFILYVVMPDFCRLYDAPAHWDVLP